MKRRNFFKTLSAAGIGLGINTSLFSKDKTKSKNELIKPPRLKKGDTVGLITAASLLFETQQTLIEAREKMESLGFKVKFGDNVGKKWGYLAGSDEDRIKKRMRILRSLP